MQEFREPHADAASLRSLLYLPAGYADAANAWPLILFLHGAGERGEDIELVKVHGLPRRLTEGFALPCVVVAPQCPAEQRWNPDALAALLDAVERTYAIDPERVYLTGMSMGGAGCWALTLAQPHRFAAIAPVCGRGDPASACAIAHVPTWAFHGALDDVVPLERSEEMVRALRACGGDARLTVYPEAGHDSWALAYADLDLYGWLLQHRRSHRPA